MSTPDYKKAYEDLDFLKSHHARTIRILAEYLEPQARFRSEKIKNTVVFFGSARTPAPEKINENSSPRDRRNAHYYSAACELSKKLTAWSMGLDKGSYYLCSGGGPGIMEATSRGAKEAGGKSIGFNISLPFEQTPNPYTTDRLQFEFHYFFMRKFWFIYLAKAIVAFPGGFGTLDEVCEALTLIQTKKLQKKPLVLLFGREFWDKNLNVESMLEWGTISPEDKNLIIYSDDVDDAFEKITTGLLNMPSLGQ